jgi:two-component system, response regulator PdtaR
MKRITIFGQDGIVNTHLEEVLTDMGYIVTGIATTGEEALAMAKKLQPDLVFCDEMLSGQVDGLSAALAIIQDLKIPVLFASAGDRYFPKLYLAATGCWHHIQKPFLSSDIQNHLEQVLPIA